MKNLTPVKIFATESVESGDAQAEPKVKRSASIKSRKKTLAPLLNQDLTRTHKAFGLFPNALLLFGYGESKQENERIIITEEKNIQTGEVITRQMKIYTNSAKGLPRGRDPQVLIALLHMTLQKPGSTNSIWFRKTDLMKILGWNDTAENRQDIDEAISRYFEAAYSGLDVKVNTAGSKTKEKFSRIITDYINIDERKIRYTDNERMFSKVVFNEEVINEIRSADLSLHLNLNLIQLLQNAPTALRLYEVINYITSPLALKFEIEIKELAHNRLGVSKSKKTPGQCLQAIKPAADKLLNVGYLNSFNYDSTSRMVKGEVNKLMVSPTTTGLEPLPNAGEKRKKIILQYIALESYPNPTSTIINSLPEELLDDAEIIAELITREKNEKVFGGSFRYGGRALKQLKNLQATGEISQSLLEKIHQNVSLENADTNLLTVSQSDFIESEPESFEGAFQPDNDKAQMNLPISFTAIRAVNGEAEDLWQQCFSTLKNKLGKQVISSWFADTVVTPIGIEENTLLMQVTSENSRNWIQTNYSKVLQDAVDDATSTNEKWIIKLIV
ncbi:MAG: hypothetical protein H7Z37_07005 [Pyrinomonadaceae bacterium]|nr:hypothetical protein [Pyrinomonadaceae bacterium]